jgi:hypothetical protein
VPNGDVIKSIDMKENYHWFFSLPYYTLFTVILRDDILSEEEMKELTYSIMAKIDENFSRNTNKPNRRQGIYTLSIRDSNYGFQYRQRYHWLTDMYYWEETFAPSFSRFDSRIGYIPIEIEEIGTVYYWEDSDGNKVNILEKYTGEIE